jgi:hypothetical protein
MRVGRMAVARKEPTRMDAAIGAPFAQGTPLPDDPEVPRYQGISMSSWRHVLLCISWR